MTWVRYGVRKWTLGEMMNLGLRVQKAKNSEDENGPRDRHSNDLASGCQVASTPYDRVQHEGDQDRTTHSKLHARLVVALSSLTL